MPTPGSPGRWTSLRGALAVMLGAPGPRSDRGAGSDFLWFVHKYDGGAVVLYIDLSPYIQISLRIWHGKGGFHEKQRDRSQRGSRARSSAACGSPGTAPGSPGGGAGAGACRGGEGAAGLG